MEKLTLQSHEVKEFAGTEHPVPLDIIRKRADIRVKLAELSYIDQEKTIELTRIWGEKRMAITPFYDLLINSFPKNHLLKEVG